MKVFFSTEILNLNILRYRPPWPSQMIRIKLFLVKKTFENNKTIHKYVILVKCFFYYNFEVSLWSGPQNDWTQCDIGDQPVTDKALYVLPPGIQSWRCFSCFFLLLLTRKGKDYTTRSSKLFFLEHQISYHHRLFCGRTSNISIIGSEGSFFSPPNLLLTHHEHFFRLHRPSKTTSMLINIHIS